MNSYLGGVYLNGFRSLCRYLDCLKISCILYEIAQAGVNTRLALLNVALHYQAQVDSEGSKNGKRENYRNVSRETSLQM